MEIVIGLVAAVVGGLVGWVAGRMAGAAIGHRAGVDQTERELGAVLDEVSAGRLPSGGPTGSFATGLRSALKRAWAPRDAERRTALVEAVGRVSRFLDRNVRAPLKGARPDAPADELRERIGQALGALEDVDFFLAPTSAETRGTDLVALAQKLSREFAQDQGVGVRLHLGTPTLRATVAPATLQDALYLILHNAARFGGDGTIDMTVVEEGGRAHIRVRDRGAGFTPEAFERAFDPFYSTTYDGLGLGLPHARKSIEAMGGHIELRNVPDGGAEVEITLPRA